MFSSRITRTLLFTIAIVILLIAFAAWLEACQAQKAAQISRPTSPDLTTATAAPTAVAGTSTPQPTAAKTATPLPSATAIPAAAPAHTPIITDTSTNTGTDIITDANLVEGLPDSEVWLIIVLRANGKFDQYRIPAEQVRPYLMATPPDYSGYQALIDSIVHLKAGDSIYAANYANTPGLSAPPPTGDTAQPNPTQPPSLPQAGN